MKLPKYKSGLILAIIYLIVVAVLIVNALVCDGTYCGLSALIATLPWIYLTVFLESYISVSDPVELLIAAMSAVLNAIIIYWIVVGILNIPIPTKRNE